jgi:hypothetical protein
MAYRADIDDLRAIAMLRVILVDVTTSAWHGSACVVVPKRLDTLAPARRPCPAFEHYGQANYEGFDAIALAPYRAFRLNIIRT